MTLRFTEEQDLEVKRSESIILNVSEFWITEMEKDIGS